MKTYKNCYIFVIVIVSMKTMHMHTFINDIGLLQSQSNEENWITCSKAVFRTLLLFSVHQNAVLDFNNTHEPLRKKIGVFQRTVKLKLVKKHILLLSLNVGI